MLKLSHINCEIVIQSCIENIEDFSSFQKK